MLGISLARVTAEAAAFLTTIFKLQAGVKNNTQV